MAAKNTTTLNSALTSKYGNIDAEFTNPANDEAWESVQEYIEYKRSKFSVVPKHRDILVKQNDGKNIEMTNENQTDVNTFVIKTPVVNVINNLTSNSTTDALAAIQGKQLLDIIGNINSLSTTVKDSVINAINELVGRIVSLEEHGGGDTIEVINSWSNASSTNVASASLVYTDIRNIINRLDQIEAAILSVDIYDCGNPAVSYADEIDCGNAYSDYDDILDFNE